MIQTLPDTVQKPFGTWKVKVADIGAQQQHQFATVRCVFKVADTGKIITDNTVSS